MVRANAGKARFMRALLLILGLVLGLAVGLILYTSIRRRRQNGAAPVAGDAPAKHADFRITLPPLADAVEGQTRFLPLEVTALPARFVRREKGVIRVETLPGARCKIDALYSTGRRPTSLDAGSVMANEQGVCEWAWQIGTGGSHVAVTVRAWLDGYQEAAATLRVQVLDPRS